MRNKSIFMMPTIFSFIFGGIAVILNENSKFLSEEINYLIHSYNLDNISVPFLST